MDILKYSAVTGPDRSITSRPSFSFPSSTSCWSTTSPSPSPPSASPPPTRGWRRPRPSSGWRGWSPSPYSAWAPSPCPGPRNRLRPPRAPGDGPGLAMVPPGGRVRCLPGRVRGDPRHPGGVPEGGPPFVPGPPGPAEDGPVRPRGADEAGDRTGKPLKAARFPVCPAEHLYT